MSWLLKHRKKDDKYRIWTIISDGWITDWLVRDEIIEAIRGQYFSDYKKDFDKLKKTFPNNWYEKDTHKIITDNRYMSIADWHKEQYEKLTGKKLSQLNIKK